MTDEYAEHCCDLPHCDGTRLGHDLAAEFPEETRRYEDAMDRLRGLRDDRVDPADLVPRAGHAWGSARPVRSDRPVRSARVEPRGVTDRPQTRRSPDRVRPTGAEKNL